MLCGRGETAVIILLFGTFLVLLLLGIPIAVSMGLTSMLVLLSQDSPLVIIPARMFAGTDSFPLVAVPFFILAGDLLAKGKISEKLVQFADSVLGFLKGGLWVVSVMASMFFAAISGSGAATTAAVGTPLIPELNKKKYDPDFSAALVAAGGCTGVVIPPSVPMIIYAVIADQSVAKLFLNGFIPGIMMGLTLIGIALYVAYKHNYPRGARFSLVNIGKTFLEAIPGLLTPIIILGGIFSGFFTPSEAAVIAVDWAFIVAIFIYRDMKWKDIFNILARSAITTSIIMFIIACAASMSWILANWQIPPMIASAVLSLSDNVYLVLLMISVIVLIAGLFMETASAIIILTPVFLPIVERLGVDLVHFGIIIVLGFAIGMVTPPVAINLYVASTVSGLAIERISKAVIPLLIGLILVWMLVIYLPFFVNLIF